MCVKLPEDRGTMLDVSGVGQAKYEKYGHLSDCLDYLLCYYLRDSWYKFKSGDSNGSIIATTPAVYNGFNY